MAVYQRRPLECVVLDSWHFDESRGSVANFRRLSPRRLARLVGWVPGNEWVDGTHSSSIAPEIVSMAASAFVNGAHEDLARLFIETEHRDPEIEHRIYR